MKKDVLYAIGEALIDFIPQQVGCPFDDVRGFSPAVGGAPTNVCGAFARLGGKARLITQLGDDPFGHKIERELSSFGVDTSLIRFTDEANTALAFVSLDAKGGRTFSFYRKPSADMLYTGRELTERTFSDAFALHFCSVSLGDYPMRDAHRAAVGFADRAGAIVSFDPNLRFQLWSDRTRLYDTVREFMPMADIVKLSDEELVFITGETESEKALPTLLRGKTKLVLYTCGGAGAYAFDGSKSVFSPSAKVSAADTTGAGDGFVGSFLSCLLKDGKSSADLAELSRAELKEYLDFANRFCGISVTRRGAIQSYPTMAEMSVD